MAKEPRRVSGKPSEAERGGGFSFPVGSTVEVTEAEYTTWGEFGEKAVTRGRKADDPVLRIVGEVEGKDDPMTVGLGCGKSERLEPSRDGEYLVIAEGSSATGMSDSSNAQIFLNSLIGQKGDTKSEAFKRHGKTMLDEDLLDNGISKALVGLKFVAGSVVVERDFRGDDEEQEKRRGGGKQTALVADEIVEEPSGEGSSKKDKTSKTSKRDRDDDDDEDEADDKKKRSKKDEEDEDEDDKPKSKRSKKDKDEEEDEDKDEGGDDEEAAEKAVLEVLEQPKYRKGLPFDKAMAAVYNVVKGQKNAKAISELAEDRNWMTKKARPWTMDDEDVIKAD